MFEVRCIGRILAWLRGRRVAVDGILPAPELRAAIERERARALRHGRPFSLAIFDVGRRAPHAAFARALRRRTRLADEIGWLDARRIAVILPDTAGDGARRLAEDVRRLAAAASDADAVTFSIATYPSVPGGEGLPQPAGRAEPALPAAGSPRHDRSPAQREPLPVACDLTADRASDNAFEPLFHFAAPAIPRWKRAMDVAGALLALIILSPLLLLVALLIKRVSPGPVFFRQVRIGYLGRPFACWKFRTMHAGNDTAVHERHLSKLIQSDEPMTKLDAGRDPRVIPFGSFLRRSAIDELPQLVNVLRGEMSLIGPRPCLPYEAAQFLPWQRQRFEALPGMTGLWQVSGKNATTFKRMMRLDIAYARGQSVASDLRIMLKTAPTLLKQLRERGAKGMSHGSTA